MLSAVLFLLANALFIGCCLFGLKAAHRRLKRRRVLLIILVSVALTAAASILIEKLSEPAPPGEAPSLTDEP